MRAAVSPDAWPAWVLTAWTAVLGAVLQAAGGWEAVALLVGACLGLAVALWLLEADDMSSQS